MSAYISEQMKTDLAQAGNAPTLAQAKSMGWTDLMWFQHVAQVQNTSAILRLAEAIEKQSSK